MRRIWPRLCVILALVSFTGCKKRGPAESAPMDVQSGAKLEPGVLLNIPACLPNCKPEDRDRIAADSRMEQSFLTGIGGATKTVDFSMYTFSLAAIYEALVAAADRGVVVRGIVDKGQFATLGKSCTPKEGCELEEPFNTSAYLPLSVKERLRYIETNNLWPKDASRTEKLAILFYKLPNGSGVKPAPGQSLVHNKLAIIDSEWLISGSGNWSSTGLSINLENQVIASRAKSPAVLKSYQCMVDTVWTGDPNIIHRDLEKCQTSEVYFTPVREGQGILPALVAEIDGAQSFIDIAMHHLTHPDLVAALTRALQRGVKIRFVTDDDACNTPLSKEVKSLVDAKTEVRYMKTNCKMFQLSHNKFGIIDGKKVLNGSANWSKSGLSKNYENFLFLTDAQEVESFQEAFEKIWGMAETRQQCSCDVRKPECREAFCLDSQKR